VKGLTIPVTIGIVVLIIGIVLGCSRCDRPGSGW